MPTLPCLVLLCLTAAGVTDHIAGDNAAPVKAPVLELLTINASQQKDPQPNEMASLYPAQARKAGTRGAVALVCRAAADGHFSDCQVLSESPRAAGSADAAKVAAAHVRAPDAVRRSQDPRAVLPIYFKTDEDPEWPASARAAWRLMPKGEDVARVYPKGALTANLEGETTMTCRVTPDGRLADCLTVRESPYGWGFGDAFLRLAPRLQMGPTLKDGSPAPFGAIISIPMRFRLPTG